MKKNDKILKTFMALSIASVAVAGLGFISFFVKIGVTLAVEKSARENGYEKFNQHYKAERLAEFTEKFKAGEITSEELLEINQNIEDYDRNDYMEKYANAEELEKYRGLVKTDEALGIGIWAIPTGIVLYGLSAVPAAIIECKKLKDRKEDKEEEIAEESATTETKLEYVDYEYVSEYGGEKVPVAWDVTPEGKLQKPEVPEIKFEK